MDTPDIQIIVEAGDWPPKRKLRALAEAAVKAAVEVGALRSFARRELSIVFTDDAAMRRLNKTWRGVDKPTDVLSFPQERGLIHQTGGSLLGDVILAAETVAREAAVASKPLEDHMAHLIIHGFLHLLGYDHQGEAEAAQMEQLERVALESLGIPDPYAPALTK